VFFVTGLPRSRTSWFSLYLDCEHEALNGLQSKQEFYDLMPTIKGDSDCGLFLTDFQERWDAPTVIIRRPVKEVYNSVLPLMDLPDDMLDILHAVDSRLDDLRGLHVPFDEIDERLEEITNYLGEPYDEARAVRYKAMRVEPMNVFGSINSVEVWL